ncbi:hypothetical protein SBV1_410113 [Verrucomicrobia bacterium]|nr:hypothetical protein SBV1_410113 [Verrucomicrobiota bacterium]
MSQPWEHLKNLTEADFASPPVPIACEECLKEGTRWVSLRECMTCGHGGCCDSSPGKHATRHFHKTQHPVMRSNRNDAGWTICRRIDSCGNQRNCWSHSDLKTLGRRPFIPDHQRDLAPVAGNIRLMSTRLIPDSATNRFAVVATIEDTSLNERGQAGPTLTHGLSEAEMEFVVVRRTAWSKTKRRRG